jgi:tetratricopeptide (TPR) repeat protein
VARKSRQRKSRGQHLPQAPAGKTVSAASAIHKPWQIAAICLVLALVTVFVYRGSRSSDFLNLDDYSYVLENRHVQQGVNTQSIAWAFTTFQEGNWHPLTWISHMVDWSLYGKKNLGSHHMTSVYWHAANAVLLFLLFFYMTGFLGRSAIVAFLFALHPAHVESVAWISERKDVLCAFFWFAALLAYVWYVRRPSWKRYACVVCGFACALMSKPMAVTLPLTLLLLDFWPLRRISFAPETRAQLLPSLWKLCVEKWPLFVMAAISSVVTIFAQGSHGAVGSFQIYPLWERICNAAISYWRYMRITFWPHPLMAYYYYDFNHVIVSAVVLSVIVLIVITVLCWNMRQEKPYCLFGWLWFLVTLVPVIGIVQVGVQAMAERYTYIPIIGLFIAVVWLVGGLVAKSPKLRIAAQLLAVAVLVACAVKTDAQVRLWKDSATLFSHVLAIDPRGNLPNYSMGEALMRQGRNAEAEKYFERALTYSPNASLTLAFSAFCLMRTAMQTDDPGNLPLAGQRLQHVLSITPDDPQALTYMALWSAMMGKPMDQEAYSRKVIATHPEFIQARLYLGDALGAQNKFDEAAQAYSQVLVIDPDNTDALNSLGVLYDRQDLKQEAIKEFRLSLVIKPDQAMPHSQMAKIYMDAHQLPEAVEELTQAVRHDPANANAHNGLGVALAQLGNYEKAAEQFSDAVRIDPAYADARRNLDLAQAKMKNEKTGTREK